MLGVSLAVGGAKLFTRLATRVGSFFGKLAARRAQNAASEAAARAARIDANFYKDSFIPENQPPKLRGRRGTSDTRTRSSSTRPTT